MRVALFSPEYPPLIFGGLGTHVAHLTAALSGRVHYELFLPDYAGYPSALPNSRIHLVPVDGGLSNVDFWLSYSRAAARLAFEVAPDVDLIHCHEWMTVAAGLQLRDATGVPVIYNVHLPQ